VILGAGRPPYDRAMKKLAVALIAIAVPAWGAMSSSAAPTSAGAIAYAKFGPGFDPSIYIAGLDGSHSLKLASHADTPVIAPDASVVAYYHAPRTRAGQPSLRLVSADGSGDHQIAANLRDLEPDAWSPAADAIAVVVGPELGAAQRLVVINVRLGTTTTIATGFIHGLSWAPDGSELVYGLSPHSDFPGKVDLYVASPSGAAPTQITHDHRSGYPIWGASTIAFQRYAAKQPRNDNPKANLFLVKPDGSGLRQLTHGTAPRFLTGLAPLAFSADGTRLLAEFGGQDTSYAQTVDPTTGKVRTVGSLTNDYIAMGLSKDGSTILTAKGGFDPNGTHSLVTFPYGGGTGTTIVHGAYFATWTR
jgi:hypothetical protein